MEDDPAVDDGDAIEPIAFRQVYHRDPADRIRFRSQSDAAPTENRCEEGADEHDSDAVSHHQAIVAPLRPDDDAITRARALHTNRSESAFCVDHVVVGPTGVWVVETKQWSGKVD